MTERRDIPTGCSPSPSPPPCSSSAMWRSTSAPQPLPPHYSPISDADSNLAVGPFGWVMNLNFLGRGAMSVCLGAAIARTGPRTGARTTGVVLLIAAGIGSALLAFFATDIGPPTTPTGYTHLAIAAAGFVLALAAITVLTVWARDAGLAHLRAASVLLVVAWVGLVALGVSAAAVPQVLAFVRRVCLVGILGWAFVVAVSLARAHPVAPPDPAAARRPDGRAPATR